MSLTITGETTLRMSSTSPPLVTITVPGEIIFSPLGYCCDKDNESLPVGTFTPIAQQKSLKASTAAYKRASSPFCERQGHIQLAERLIFSIADGFSSSVAIGAQTMLVNDSATESTLPASGLANPACGA